MHENGDILSGMHVVESYPPNIEKIHQVIDPEDTKHACFTYGDAIHNPSGGYIDECVGIHEAHHSIQQEAVGGPDVWWDRWLHDVNFRARQELEAYGLQFRRFCELNADRNKRAKELHRLATDLSSMQYGGVVAYVDARNCIRAYFKLD